MRAIFVPGNGGGSTQEGWFPFVRDQLISLGCEVLDPQYPDPELARAKFWLPFLESLGIDDQTILIGHSSGAEAAMRFAENHTLLGSVLVSPCYTDLGMKEEKESGYYDNPWNWDAIRANQKWIIQFSSTDDPFIPISEARFIHTSLNTEYHEFEDKEHFGYPNPMPEFPELVEALKAHL